jgi:hypothetical protein
VFDAEAEAAAAAALEGEVVEAIVDEEPADEPATDEEAVFEAIDDDDTLLGVDRAEVDLGLELEVAVEDELLVKSSKTEVTCVYI